MVAAVVVVRVSEVVRDQSRHSAMRVLHVIPSVSERSGGPGIAILPMCRALQQRGVEVLLIATDKGLRRVESSRAIDYEDVPAIFFRSQFGESFKYSRPLSMRSEEHTSELQSQSNLVCRLLLEK